MLKNKKLCVFATLTLLASILGGASLIAAVLNGYDSKIQHFETGNIFVSISAICFIAALAAASVAAFFARKTKVNKKEPTYFTRFTAAFAAILSLASFIMNVALGGFGELDILGRLASLLGLLAAAYLLVVAFNTEIGGGLPLLALVCVLRFVAVLMQVYFSSLYAINAPIKSYLLVMYCAAILFFCAETRVSLGRMSAPRVLLFTLFEVACGSIAPAFAICDLISGEVLLFDVLTAIGMTAIWLFAISRALSLIGSLEKNTAPAKAEPSDHSSEAEDAEQL